jgi:hypothetical protein
VDTIEYGRDGVERKWKNARADEKRGLSCDNRLHFHGLASVVAEPMGETRYDGNQMRMMDSEK